MSKQKTPKQKIRVNTVNRETGELRPEIYIWLCDLNDAVNETEKAIKFSVGTTCSGLPIEVFIPKSVIILKVNKNLCDGGLKHVYIPLNIARNKGIGWHIVDEYTYLPDGYMAYNEHMQYNYQQDCNDSSVPF